MKKLNNILLLLLLCTTFVSVGQTKTLDSLVQKIDNNDVYVVILETISPRINGVAENEIIALGKDATPSLIKVLDDKNKGIVAHVLLSKIWNDKFPEATCCNLQYIRNTEILIINGLKIYIEDNTLVATQEDLKKNKENWVRIVAS